MSSAMQQLFDILTALWDGEHPEICTSEKPCAYCQAAAREESEDE